MRKRPISLALAIQEDRARRKALAQKPQPGPALLTDAVNAPAPKKIHGFALWAKRRAETKD